MELIRDDSIARASRSHLALKLESSSLDQFGSSRLGDGDRQKDFGLFSLSFILDLMYRLFSLDMLKFTHISSIVFCFGFTVLDFQVYIYDFYE